MQEKNIQAPRGIPFLYSLVVSTSSVLLSLSDCPEICPYFFYLQHTTKTSAGFETEIPASDQPQTLALHRSATGISLVLKNN
jgi:hypothetical protein